MCTNSRNRSVHAQDRQCCTYIIVCAVVEFVSSFHARLDPLEGNWSNYNKKASNSYFYPSNRSDNVDVLFVAHEECVC